MISDGATMLRGSLQGILKVIANETYILLLQATHPGCHGPEEKTTAELLICLKKINKYCSQPT